MIVLPPPPGSRESTGADDAELPKSDGDTARLSVAMKPWNQRRT